MGFDTKCFEVADHFLAEESEELKKRSPELAQVIQDAVEDWINYEKLPDCGFCGSGAKATHEMDCQDVTPTDRGDWVQHYKQKCCLKCFSGERELLMPKETNPRNLSDELGSMIVTRVPGAARCALRAIV